MIERSPHTAVSGVIATRLAAVFGCTLEYLLNGIGKAPSQRAVRAAIALATTRAIKREERAERAERLTKAVTARRA